jgi:murein DD-endopeptidase MepM/ murein hydrolase activator NlpD
MRSYGKSLILAAAMAAVAGVGVVYTAPAEARVAVSIYAPIAPPALRVETVPAARAGYVWAPGYWGYSHRKYNWRGGHWVRARHGYNYNAPRWEQDGNRWRYHGERWEH